MASLNNFCLDVTNYVFSKLYNEFSTLDIPKKYKTLDEETKEMIKEAGYTISIDKNGNDKIIKLPKNPKSLNVVGPMEKKTSKDTLTIIINCKKKDLPRYILYSLKKLNKNFKEKAICRDFYTKEEECLTKNSFNKHI